MSHSDERLNSFESIGQVLIDNAVTKLKSPSLMAYPVHVLLLRFSVSPRPWFIEISTPWLCFNLLRKTVVESVRIKEDIVNGPRGTTSLRQDLLKRKVEAISLAILI